MLYVSLSSSSCFYIVISLPPFLLLSSSYPRSEHYPFYYPSEILSHPPPPIPLPLRQVSIAPQSLRLRLRLPRRFLRSLLLLPALPRPASTQYCDPGAAIFACDAVLVVCADSESHCADVQSTLLSTASFSTVDTFAACSAWDGSGTPNASQLASYHAILAFSNPPFADPVLLGDRLAAFHDQGGGVVVATDANFGESRLKGTYGSAGSGYALLDYARGVQIWPPPSDSLGDVLEPQSPLMAGVSSLAASAVFRSTAPPISGRAIVVARWRGGGKVPLVLRGTRGNRTLVELNLYPPSSSAYPLYWTGDGALLLRNALMYSRCMPCKKGTYAGAGGGGGGGGEERTMASV
jgi:hypothetical protein